jgi:hypothetical protein
MTSLGVLLLAYLGHRFVRAYLAPVAIGAASSAVVYLLARRIGKPTRRAYVRAAGITAMTWLAMAWAHGVDRPALVALGIAGTLLSIPWWWHWRIRAGVEIEWVDLDELWALGWREFVRQAPGAVMADLGRLIGALRELRRYRRDWPVVSYQHGRGLVNSEIVAGKFTEHLARLTIDLEGGKHIEDIDVPELESALDVPHGRVKVRSGAGQSARRVTIEIVRATTPLPDRLPWKGSEASSVFEPIRLGEFAGGREVRLRLVHPKGEERGKVVGHVAIGGKTGWGKGALARLVLRHLTACEDAEVWVLDPKGGVDTRPWAPLLAQLVTDSRDAVRFLQRVEAEIRRREAELVRRVEDNWMQREGDRLLVLLVDETAELPNDAKALLESIVRMGRASGVVVIAMTQRWSAAGTGKEGSGDFRSQFEVKVGLHVERFVDSGMLFGEGSGYHAERLDVPGRALIESTALGYTTPEPLQVYWTPGGAAVRDLVALRCAARPRSVADPAVGEETARRVVPLAQSLPPPSVEPAPPEQREAGGRRDDVRALVRNALAEAGTDGVSAKELARQIGRGNSQTYRHLSELVSAGEAVKVEGTALYRLADLRPRLVVQEETR